MLLLALVASSISRNSPEGSGAPVHSSSHSSTQGPKGVCCLCLGLEEEQRLKLKEQAESFFGDKQHGNSNNSFGGSSSNQLWSMVSSNSFGDSCNLGKRAFDLGGSSSILTLEHLQKQLQQQLMELGAASSVAMVAISVMHGIPVGRGTRQENHGRVLMI